MAPIQLFRGLSQSFSRINSFVLRPLSHRTFTSKALGRLYSFNRLQEVHPKQEMAKFSTSSTRQLDLSGVYPPIVTAFEADEEISYGKLEENFQKWNKLPFSGEFEVPSVNCDREYEWLIILFRDDILYLELFTVSALSTYEFSWCSNRLRA